MEKYWFIAGASIFLVMGTIHLIYTFFGNQFEAFDERVTQTMKRSTLMLTKETTIWRAWIGFNASHSLGAMLVGGFYIPLALFNFEVIEKSYWFSCLPLLIGISYLLLAKKYWFKVPFFGILLSTMCFAVATFLSINR